MKNIFQYVFFLLILFRGLPCAAEQDASHSVSKTLFITGGAGFIGSNFLQYMFDKYPQYQFVVLDALTYAGSLENIPDHIRKSNRFSFVYASILEEDLVDKIMSTADWVVHFAAETHVTRSIMEDHVFFETDVMGTRALMSALVKHANKVERFIHISTSEVYGTSEYMPMDENHPLKPRSPYAAAKTGADRLVYAYSCTYDIPVVILRPFNNYGPCQHLEKVIPHFITSAMQNKPLTIHGHGDQKRDWIYTKDVAIAIDKALHLQDFSKIKNQEINIGSGKALSVLEIAQLILKCFHLPETFLSYVADRPGQVECHISSTDKAFTLLGWTPTISIEEGLQMTVDWYRDHPSHWKKMEPDAVVSLEY